MVYSEDAYLYGSEVPMYDEKEPVQITKPKVIPMPFIKEAKGSKDKVIVTEDWYVKTKKKKLARLAKDKKDIQIEMMQLLGQKDILKSKLSKLDESKKKDMKKIISINVKIKDIDAELEMLQKESGIIIDELDKGSKIGRFFSRVKRSVKKKFKKVKRFCKYNSELVTGILSIVVPIFAAVIGKKLLALIA